MDSFDEIREAELKIIKQLYTVNILYKNTLSKKIQSNVVDEFMLNYLNIPSSVMSLEEIDGIYIHSVQITKGIYGILARYNYSKPRSILNYRRIMQHLNLDKNKCLTLRYYLRMPTIWIQFNWILYHITIMMRKQMYYHIKYVYLDHKGLQRSVGRGILDPNIEVY